MASQLTTISVTARKSIRYGIYLIIILIVGRIAFNIVRDIYRAAVPPKAPAPTLGFGPLEKIPFPSPTTELPTLEYTVETASGFLPQFPELMKVYGMPRPTANLFSYENMITRAQAFGFSQAPLQLSERLYKFSRPRVPATFETDIINSVFSLSFNLAADSSPLNSRSPSVEEAKRTLISRLQSASSYPEDLSGPVEHIFLKVEGQNLVRALALADAQLVQINLFRKPLEQDEEGKGGFPVVTADPNKANVWFIISGSGERDKQIIAGEYKYFPVDTNLVHTYPIKTAEDSLKELANGGGYIASLGLNISGKITITDIYLGYYDPNAPSSFFIPVVVFKGRDGFLAYVPAVTNEHFAE